MSARAALAAAGLAAALAATSAAAGSPVYNGPPDRVVSETGKQLCRYWLGSGYRRGWQDYLPVEPGDGFTLRARVPGETVTPGCYAPRGGKRYVVAPDTRYRAFRDDAGRVVVARKT